MSTEDEVTVSLTVKEFAAVSGILATWSLLHDNETARRGASARDSMCRQVGIDPEVGLEVSREALNTPAIRWLAGCRRRSR